jgi:asparagine synthase (glutamine-hydrolysing)
LIECGIPTTGLEIWAQARAAVDALGYPTSFTSIPAVMNLYSGAKQRSLKVLLEGQGADELFGGYSFLNGWNALGLVTRNCSVSDVLIAQRAKHSSVGALRQRLYRLLLATDMSDALDDERTVRDQSEWLIALQTRTVLPSLLSYGDRLSLFNGVEVRQPYLDYRIVDFANSLPLDMKLRNGERKLLLRYSADAYVPQWIINRTKVGFATPLASLIEKRCSELLEIVSHDCALLDYNIISKKGFRRLKAANLAGLPVSRILWRILTTEAWLRQYSPQLAQ